MVNETDSIATYDLPLQAEADGPNATTSASAHSLEYRAEDHTYWIGDRRIPSVTDT